MARTFEIGINYWPRKCSLAMWRSRCLDEVIQDLEKIASIGFTSVRIFLLLRDFVDPDLGLRKEALETLHRLIEHGCRLGLKIYPTLVTIHMSGWNWFNPFHQSIYTFEFLDKAVHYVRRIVEELRGYPCIAGWIVTNEFSNVESPPRAEHLRMLVESIACCIKDLDERSVGFGDAPTTGLEPESLASMRCVDLADPHIYYYDNDDVRHTMFYTYVASRYLAVDKEVVLEEVGASTAIFDERSLAKFFEVVTLSTLANGGKGIFLWCYSDYAEENEKLLDIHPYELRFGILRSDGSPKPIVETVQRLRRFVDTLRDRRFFEEYMPRPRSTAIIVPRHFSSSLPFHRRYPELYVPTLLECFIHAKNVGLAPIPLPEDFVEKKRYPLILAPSTLVLRASTWRTLLRYVEQGSTIYYSMLRLRNEAHKAPCHLWNEIFGVEPALPMGRIGKRLDSYLEIELRIGRAKKYVVRLDNARISVELFYVPFKPIDAEIVGYINGEPFLFLAKRGEGYAVLSSIPLELVLGTLDVVDRSSSPLLEIYRWLAELAGIEPLFVANDPRIELEYWIHRNGDRYTLFVINHSYDDVSTYVRIVKQIEILDVLYGDRNSVDFANSHALKVVLPAKSGLVFETKVVR